tara:strand:- start:215 stop:2020 length:1806 start_codon:yes stop_codon:yes gene_type:complete
MPKKNDYVNIKYTSRDFESIKVDLVEYAKRYYPNTYRDFSDASFGSLLFDTVAYVGDVLSYYVDYSVNESFLDTAIEYDNIRKHARALGYKFSGIPTSFGTAAIFVLVPSNADGTAPDTSYLPILRRGASFRSSEGGTFSLTEDADFNSSDTEVVAARFDSSTGQTTYFAVKVYGQVSSGVYQRVEADLTSATYERFRRIKVGANDISEIVSVLDSDGNEYYEVEYLSQEVVFLETTNQAAASDGVRSILKPFVATRRFVVEQDDTGTYIQFGFGSESIDDQSGLAEPSRVSLNLHGRRQITNASFDPTKMLGTNKLGVSPQATTLTIIYKVNDSTNVNASSNTMTDVLSSDFRFTDEESLSSSEISSVIASIEVTNEEPITGDVAEFTPDELKVRAKTHYAAQGRAVTKQDYESLVYSMPAKFGTIKRASIINDPSATNRRMPLYLMSENSDGELTACNTVTKQNLKNWLSTYRSINDVIDIFDAKIINFGVDFKILTDRRKNTQDVLDLAVQEVKDLFSETLYVGEPLYLTNIYNALSKLDGVVDVKKVKVFNKTGGSYSTYQLDFDEIMSRDGTYLKVPDNVVLELKKPDSDIRGVAR